MYNQEQKILYEKTFKDTKEFIEYYFDYRLNQAKQFTCYKEDRLASMLFLNKHPVIVNGQYVDCDYIFGVATDEEYRNKGYMTELINEALTDMNNRKLPFTYLIPAVEGIYEKSDFVKVTESDSITFTRNMMAEPIIKISGLRVIKAENSDVEKLSKFVDKSSMYNYGIHHARTKEYFETMLLELLSENGELLMLVNTNYNNELLGFAFISNEDEVKILDIECEEEIKSFFATLICERYNTREITMNINEIMIRIVNIEAMVSLINANYMVPNDVDKRLEYFRITDSMIPENNGIFNVKYVGKNGIIRKISNKEKVIGNIHEFSISEFAKWMICEINGFSNIMLNDIV